MTPAADLREQQGESMSRTAESSARIALAWCPALAAGAPFAQRAVAQEAPQDAPEAPPPGFVTAVNGDFYVDGRQFRHVGVNTPGLLYERQAEAITDLDGMRNSGIKQVRVFLPNSRLSTVDIGNRLQWVLDRAWERGIRVTVPFTDFYGGRIWAENWYMDPTARHRVPGDDGYYTICIDHCGEPDPNNRTLVLNSSWFSGGYTQNYLPFVRYIVGRFAYHPAVFAWEIANEARTDPYSTAKTFYTNMVREIKAIDPNHIVAPGIISTHWLGIAESNNTERDAFYRDTGLDYVTIHSGGGIDQHKELLDLLAARRLNKPLVVEETGMNSLCRDRPAYFPIDFFDRMGTGLGGRGHDRPGAARGVRTDPVDQQPHHHPPVLPGASGAPRRPGARLRRPGAACFHAPVRRDHRAFATRRGDPDLAGGSSSGHGRGVPSARAELWLDGRGPRQAVGRHERAVPPARSPARPHRALTKKGGRHMPPPRFSAGA